MKIRLPRWSRSTNPLAPISAALFLMIAMRGLAEPLPLERAIRLALAHSTGSATASADVQRAFASYRELRNNYVPQFILGSGIGWTYGYPLSIEGSAPALANVVSQSSIFNAAQVQFLKAAKIDWHASEIQDKDQRDAVIQDVALTYAELVKWEARLVRLEQDATDAQKMEHAVSDRLRAGVDSTVDLNKAKLTSARVRLHRAEARGNADVLRRHLSTLTGLPVSAVEIAPETIPALPPVAREENLPEKAVASSAVVKVAEQHSLAEAVRAAGEHRALYPSVDFSAQYARFSTFNNYETYFPAHTFQVNNATIGLALRIPLFNASQRARAEGPRLRPSRPGSKRRRLAIRWQRKRSSSNARPSNLRRLAKWRSWNINSPSLASKQPRPRSTPRPAPCMNWPTRACRQPNASCFFRMPILSTSECA
jgi:outer membrane protein